MGRLTRHHHLVAVMSRALGMQMKLPSITSTAIAWTTDRRTFAGCPRALMLTIVPALVVPSNKLSPVPARFVGQPQPGVPMNGGLLQLVRKRNVLSMQHT